MHLQELEIVSSAPSTGGHRRGQGAARKPGAKGLGVPKVKDFDILCKRF